MAVVLVAPVSRPPMAVASDGRTFVTTLCTSDNGRENFLGLIDIKLLELSLHCEVCLDLKEKDWYYLCQIIKIIKKGLFSSGPNTCHQILIICFFSNSSFPEIVLFQ